MGEFIFRCTQIQIAALIKHISCQNYVNNIIPSLFRPVVPLARDFHSHSGSRRCDTGRAHNPSHHLQSIADGGAESVPSSFSERLLVQV